MGPTVTTMASASAFATQDFIKLPMDLASPEPLVLLQAQETARESVFAMPA